MACITRSYTCIVTTSFVLFMLSVYSSAFSHGVSVNLPLQSPTLNLIPRIRYVFPSCTRFLAFDQQAKPILSCSSFISTNLKELYLCRYSIWRFWEGFIGQGYDNSFSNLKNFFKFR